MSRVSSGVVLVVSGLLAAVGAADAKTPKPPKQLCIGSNCATTPDTTTGGKVKWNPGHYGASAGIAYPDSALAKFSPEMDDMMKDEWIKGYRLFMTWSSLDFGPANFTGSVGGAKSGKFSTTVPNGTYWAAFADGEYQQITVSSGLATWSNSLQSTSITSAHLYTTALVDQILDRMRTKYSKPKQLVIAVVAMSFSGGSRKSGDDSRIPDYITTNKAYGPSPEGSSYGWWGPPMGVKDGAYSAALYRPAVAQQYANLGRALGAKYNSDPNFEAIMDQEDSAVVGPANNFPPKDGSFDPTGYIDQMKMYLTAWVQAFPNTSVISQNTFTYEPTGTQQFEEWMIANRVAPGSSDTAGQSYYSSPSTGSFRLNGWGLAAYAGLTVNGSKWSGTDYRNQARAMVDVESGNIGSLSGGPQNNKPLDLVNGLNMTVKASHAFWCHVPSGKSTPPKWADVTAVLRDNPLTTTSYPPNYPK